MSFRRVLAVLTSILCLVSSAGGVLAQNRTTVQAGDVEVGLLRAPRIELPGLVDSNSPAVWDLVEGVQSLSVFTSAGHPSLSTGSSLRRLGEATPVTYAAVREGGWWLEAVLQDVDGTLYGYYHHEPPDVCPGTLLTAPRIGAARSTDRGATWEDLGILLEAAPGTIDCATPNKYFAGGTGDFSALLDPEHRDVYLFFSTYPVDTAQQGVAVARLLWADRDEPVGKVTVWQDGVWMPPTVTEEGGLEYPRAVPFLRPEHSWHNPSGEADAFWGPSVHWNAGIERYVMLLNRTADTDWNQEGIYVSVSTTLEDPGAWSEPVRLIAGGSWYPQVIGIQPGDTDKRAAGPARIFIAGASDYFLSFALREPLP